MNSNEKPRPHAHLGLAIILAAAIVDKEFCTLLLHDPNTALQKGYLGEPFALSAEETELFLSVRADNLTDLAKQFLTSVGSEKISGSL